MVGMFQVSSTQVLIVAELVDLWAFRISCWAHRRVKLLRKGQQQPMFQGKIKGTPTTVGFPAIVTCVEVAARGGWSVGCWGVEVGMAREGWTLLVLLFEAPCLDGVGLQIEAGSGRASAGAMEWVSN